MEDIIRRPHLPEESYPTMVWSEKKYHLCEGDVADQKLTSIPLKCCHTLIAFFLSPPDGPASGTDDIS
jgi:hypothetical protein